MLYPELSDQVLAACYAVHVSLGCGLMELPYTNALALELKYAGIPCRSQVQYAVCYRDQVVGEYFADLVIDDKIIIEVKSVSSLAPPMYSQIINYLHISGLRIGYLVNFNNPVLHYKRIII